MAHVNIVSPKAVNILIVKVYAELEETWLTNNFIVSQQAQQNHDGITFGDIDVDIFCAPVVHPVWLMIQSQEQHESQDTERYLGEWPKVCQRKPGTKGKNYIFVMNHDELSTIPEGCAVTYARVLVDFLSQK